MITIEDTRDGNKLIRLLNGKNILMDNFLLSNEEFEELREQMWELEKAELEQIALLRGEETLKKAGLSDEDIILESPSYDIRDVIEKPEASSERYKKCNCNFTTIEPCEKHSPEKTEASSVLSTIDCITIRPHDLDCPKNAVTAHGECECGGTTNFLAIGHKRDKSCCPPEPEKTAVKASEWIKGKIQAYIKSGSYGMEEIKWRSLLDYLDTHYPLKI